MFLRSLRRFFHLHLIIATLGAASLGASMDRLLLANGDSLTGEWVETTATAVVFRSPVLGLIEVPREQVAEIVNFGRPETESETQPAAEPEVASAAEEKADTMVPDSALEQAEGEEGGPEDIDPAEPRLEDDPLYGELPKAPLLRPVVQRWNHFWADNAFFRFMAKHYPLMHWKNKLQVGFNMQMGERDSQSYLIRLNTEQKWTHSNFRFEGSYEFAESTDAAGLTTRTLDRTRARGRYRHDIAKSFFVETDTNYRRSPVQRIYHDTNTTLGIGYKVFDTPDFSLAFTPRLGLAYKVIGVNRDDDFGYVAALSEDLVYTISQRLSLRQEATFTLSPTDQDDSAYIAEFTSALSNKLSRSLSLDLRYEISYDSRVVNRRARSTQTISVSLGADF